MNLGRSIINSLLPSGVAWRPKEGGDLDLYLDGVGDGYDYIIGKIKTLADIRDAKKTQYLDELEKEYGIIYSSFSDAIRRNKLFARKNGKRGTSSLPDLQFYLDTLDLGMTAYNNDPAVDPAGLGGELLVRNRRDDNLRFGFPAEIWNHIVFIGGDATRGGSDEITAIDSVDVNYLLIPELKSTIQRLKPLHIWVIMFMNAVDGNGDPLPFGFWGDPTAGGFGDVNNPGLGGEFQSV